MKTPISSNLNMEKESLQENPSIPSRFVHIHAEAINERIREAMGAKPPKKDTHGSARMNPANFFAGPHCVFFIR